jgi:UDP-2,3-diacylglucosamine pyrophosphatase LpxH
MLVIISDIHLCDGSAFPVHVDPRAFRLLLSEIYELARASRRGARSWHVDLVLLGDVFDLLRTERWFVDRQGREVPPSARPWGDPTCLTAAQPAAETLHHARAITDEIIEKNAAALAVLRGEAEGCAPPEGVTVRRIFIPGNHDRLYLHDEEIRRKVLGALGAIDGRCAGAAADGVFLHRLQMPRYGLLARHGHEWDPWNFERFRDDRLPSQYSDEDYLPTPIGDPITTELVARVPFEMRQRLAADPAFAGDPALLRICQRLQRIEDVRPTLSAFRWVFYETGRLGARSGARQARALREALTDTISAVAGSFLSLPYYRAWRERHNVAGWLDRTDKLHLLLKGTQRVLSLEFADILSFFAAAEGSMAWMSPDHHQAGAAREDLAGLSVAADLPAQDGGEEEAAPLRFVAYGHTHEPLQAPLRVGRHSDLYLNSGTFRDRQFATRDGQGFIGWQTFSYLVFYGEEERQPEPAGEGGAKGARRVGPTYERWTGTRAR